MRHTTDIAVIGAGTAGLNAVAELQKRGADWLLIEGGEYGTTCARDGCMPSKLLIAAADAAHDVARAPTFGIDTGSCRIDGPGVLGRLRRERDRFVGNVIEETLKLPEKRRLRGKARFRDARTLEVGEDQLVEAGVFIVAAGSSPRSLPMFTGLGNRVLTSDTIFEIDDLPARLAVIGSGPLGLELALAFARLGSNVTVISHSDRVGPLSDPVVLRPAIAAFKQMLALCLNAKLETAHATADGVALRWSDGERGSQGGEFERVLVAAGRVPNLTGLRMERTGASLDESGMPAWNSATTQCQDLPLFMAGDINDYRPLLHEAADEGRIAARNAAHYPDVRPSTRRAQLSIAFTDPQTAAVGTPFEDLDAREIATGCSSFENQGRARIIAMNSGVMRLYAEHSSARLLGAEMVGPQIEHLAHLLAWACQQRNTVQQLLAMPFYHPVLEEGLRTALREVSRNLEIDERIPCESRASSIGS